MQTFLPYPDFEDSAAVLDRARLGKQRVEVLQLLKAITIPHAGWSNHPAARMWRGHHNALVAYGVAVCNAWINRGYRDTCLAKIVAFRTSLVTDNPSWLGLDAFHASHRSNLLRKDPVHYGVFGWTEPLDLPYLWPIGA